MERRRRKSRDPAETARKRVVSAFCEHWSCIARTRKNLAGEREDFFLARSEAARKRLAQSYYGREHARKMANLNSSEVRETLEPWLEHAVQYWLDNEMILEEDFLEELPTAEYVSIILANTACTDERRLIDRYPGERAGYDDLYERMLSGFSTGAVLRMYKSTGECFTPFEARSVRAGIRQELLEGIADAGDEDPWAIDVYAEAFSDEEGFEDEDSQRVVVVSVNCD